MGFWETQSTYLEGQSLPGPADRISWFLTPLEKMLQEAIFDGGNVNFTPDLAQRPFGVPPGGLAQTLPEGGFGRQPRT